METLVKEMKASLKVNDDAMVAEFNEETPFAAAEFVMRHWFESPRRQFFLPALQRFAEQDNFYALLADRATVIGFLSEAMRNETNDSQKMLGLQIPLLTSIEVVDVLAAFHQLDPSHRLSAYKALRKNFDMGGEPAAVSLMKGLDAAPVKPFHQWPLPHSADSVEFQEFMAEWTAEPGKSVYDLSVVSSLMRQSMLKQWRELKAAEDTGSPAPVTEGAAAGDVTCSDDILAQFSSMIGMWMNGALYGAFCATGDEAYIQRWLDAAVPFGAFMESDEWLSLAINHSSPPSDALQAQMEAQARPAMAKMRFELSRFAFWQILMYSNFNEAFMRVVAAECGKLGSWVTRPQDSDKAVRAQMAPQEAHARVRVLPALLSMMTKHATTHNPEMKASPLPMEGPWASQR
jgi:hypothetical protein